MDTLILVSAAGLMLVSAGSIWVIYVLMNQVQDVSAKIDQINADLLDIDQDLNATEKKIHDLYSTVGWHTLAVKDLADVREAARLKRQNDTLRDMADCSKVYKQQIVANNKVIKELMP